MADDYNSYVGPRQAGLDNLAGFTDARRRRMEAIADAEYQREQQRIAQEAKSLKAAERERSLNNFNDAVKGASIGSAAGPWGALIGGVAGWGLGLTRGVQQRRSEGEGFWKALGKSVSHPMGQKFDFAEDIPAGALVNLGSKAKGWSDASAAAAGAQQRAGAAQGALENAAIAENNAAKMKRLQYWADRSRDGGNSSLAASYRPIGDLDYMG